MFSVNIIVDIRLLLSLRNVLEKIKMKISDDGASLGESNQGGCRRAMRGGLSSKTEGRRLIN